MKKFLYLLLISISCIVSAKEQPNKNGANASNDIDSSSLRIVLNGLFPDSPFEKNISHFLTKYLADYKKYQQENGESTSTFLGGSFLKANNSPSLRIEANHTKRGKAYTINGKKYIPFSSISEFTQEGVASWYGPGFHGKKTANGERFDQNALTAAHKELPLNSFVKVTRLSTGKSITVRINDRGPFYQNRIIDLSHKAAIQLGFKDEGYAEVKIELLPQKYVAKRASASKKTNKAASKKMNKRANKKANKKTTVNKKTSKNSK